MNDSWLDTELDASAPGTAERTPRLTHAVHAFGAEQQHRASKRKRGFSIAALAGAFTLVGATAAVAVPTLYMNWVPDHTVTFTSSTSGRCVISVAHTFAPEALGDRSVAEVREQLGGVIESLDYSAAGLTQMVNKLEEAMSQDDPHAAGVQPHVTKEYLTELTGNQAAFEQEAVMFAVRSAVTLQLGDAGISGERGSINLTCEDAAQ